MENSNILKSGGRTLTGEEDVFRMNTHYKRIRILKRVASHIVLIIFALFAIFPIYYVVITSLNTIGNDTSQINTVITEMGSHNAEELFKPKEKKEE